MEIPQNTLTPSGRRLNYDGDGTDFALLTFKNLILTVLTLGIYGAWARTDVRKFLWGHVSFLGDRAAYTGNGLELFKGWLRLMGLVFAILIVNKVIQLILPIKFVVISTLVIYVLYMWFFSIVMYSGYKYRVSRTRWREVNFGVSRNRETAREFTKIFLKGFFLNIFTLGFYYPYMSNQLNKYLTDKTLFGSQHFRYTGTGGGMFGLWAKGILLTILTLGIYFPWFRLELAAFRLRNTHFQNVSFKIHLTGKDLLVYTLASFFATVLTAGIAYPWIQNWGYKIFFTNIEILGDIDFASVTNMEHAGDAAADAAADYFDLDFGI